MGNDGLSMPAAGTRCLPADVHSDSGENTANSPRHDLANDRRRLESRVPPGNHRADVVMRRPAHFRPITCGMSFLATAWDLRGREKCTVEKASIRVQF